MVYAIVILITLLALGLAVFNFRYVRGMKEGTAEMSEMAGVIRDGANVFMRTEYKTIVITVAAVAVIFLLPISALLLVQSGITLNCLIVPNNSHYFV